MCGIAGFIGKKNIHQGIIDRTLGLMKNRGPDAQDWVSFQQGDTCIFMLHSRLAIIDLDDRANQPFSLNACALIFNGEIYNYRELRQQLESQGVHFKTASDTEVLLRMYLKYGEKCVDYFEGMWSFAIYDQEKHKLFLSRDRFAEKPLYYFETNEGIYFGSEIKFIKSLSEQRLTINQRQVRRYLVNGYKSLYKQQETFYNEIQELSYATNLVVENSLKKRIFRYWQPNFESKQMSLEEAIEGTRYHLLESMKIRLRADVPLAFCLSGGVDSAALTSIAAKKFNYNVATFSIIDSDERYNEYENVKSTIDDLGCQHTLIELSKEGTLKKLTELVAYHDSPISTITYLVHSFLSEAISEKGFKVAFSGTAADELFTGYYDHFNLHLYEMRHHAQYADYLKSWKAHTGQFVRNPHFKNPELYFDNPKFREHIYLNCNEFAEYLNEGFNEAFYEESYSNELLRGRMLNEMFHETVPVALHEDDLNSMKYSVENRSPFLDSRLCAFAYSIPTEYLIQDGYGKYVLRESMKGILNDQVRLDRKKKGFNASIHSVINFKDSKNLDYLFNESPVFDLVDKSMIENLVSTDLLANSYSKFLFNFINVKIFLEHQMKEAIEV